MMSAEALQLSPSVYGSLKDGSEPSSLSDYKLAQKASQGDMEAFEQIYQKHYRRVYNLALRMTRSAPEAEDLTQDVFIHLYAKIGSFRGESSFATWLHRFTFNKVLMHFRKQSVKRERTTEEGEVPLQVALGTENPQQMSVIDRIALDKAIAQLPPGYLMAFVLHDIEGYEHAEIARIMGCSVGTTKSQLHKARMKLRRLLKKEACADENRLAPEAL